MTIILKKKNWKNCIVGLKFLLASYTHTIKCSVSSTVFDIIERQTLFFERIGGKAFVETCLRIQHFTRPGVLNHILELITQP